MWIDRREAVRVLAAAKQTRFLDSVVTSLKSDIHNYEIAVNGLQIALKATREKDSTTVASFTREIGLMQSQRVELERQLSDVNKQLRRQISKTRLTSIAGVLLAVGVAIITLSL